MYCFRDQQVSQLQRTTTELEEVIGELDHELKVKGQDIETLQGEVKGLAHRLDDMQKYEKLDIGMEIVKKLCGLCGFLHKLREQAKHKCLSLQDVEKNCRRILGIRSNEKMNSITSFVPALESSRTLQIISAGTKLELVTKELQQIEHLREDLEKWLATAVTDKNQLTAFLRIQESRCRDLESIIKKLKAETSQLKKEIALLRKDKELLRQFMREHLP